MVFCFGLFTVLIYFIITVFYFFFFSFEFQQTTGFLLLAGDFFFREFSEKVVFMSVSFYHFH